MRVWDDAEKAFVNEITSFLDELSADLIRKRHLNIPVGTLARDLEVCKLQPPSWQLSNLVGKEGKLTNRALIALTSFLFRT